MVTARYDRIARFYNLIDKSANLLELGDVQHLNFADNSFDTVTATCLFCSVGDPVAGLGEAARVVRPDGQVLLVESARPTKPALG